MSLFKCKMCGGTLEIQNGESVGVCEYCGTKQTLPRLDDDRKANLYDRANHFRRNNEFDKAMGIYEQILNEDNTDAEAYWSVVLCRYGIEYVEDPSTHKRIPTVNRTQFTSIFADEDYKAAFEHADGAQKEIYEHEAKTIDEIQKGILAISQKEEPFDVFICYKETDNNGRRTPDSVLANDLYHQLTQEGFKVFFARITLEDKLGQEYEPYIFAALNSAKVMVVLGTKPEYFNAVWVKNEWSRYLALIRQGQKKILIPAYKDMDPYDLPDEFSHLQAQDMSKLGFMQDLIRGIKKIAQADEPKPAAIKETVAGGNTNTAPLLRRAFMFLEDGNWESADEYCEKVLDIDPENAEAYLGKLMAELKVRKQEDLCYCEEPLDCKNNYNKVLRFCDERLRKELENDNKIIIEHKAEIVSKKAEERAKRNKKIVIVATSIVCAIVAFAILFNEAIVPKLRLNKAIKLIDSEEYESAYAILEKLGEGDIISSYKYECAVKLIASGDYKSAYNLLKNLGYNDSNEKLNSIKTQCAKALFAEAKVGETVPFGSYEQDNDDSNGKEDIEWLVLAKEKDKIFVVSSLALDCQPYNTKNTGVTWETCSLREWLNDEFFSSSFNETEQKIILDTFVSGESSSPYEGELENTVIDKLFLLSIKEASMLNKDQKTCQATKYAVDNGIYSKSATSNCRWWLRSPGSDKKYAAHAYESGMIHPSGSSVSINNYGVRPAMWIDISGE